MRFIRMPHDRIVYLLLLVSVALYLMDYFLFGRMGEIGFGFMSNVAFLPVYVLFVTLMIERVLREREREAMIKKLNMVIGIFFSEVGTQLLRDFLEFFTDGQGLRGKLNVTVRWREEDYRAARDFIKSHEIRLDARLGDLPRLKEFLSEKKGVMLSLMENPNLLEHESFTDLLWAVFHLIEELQARQSLASLPASDLEHLAGDMKRAHNHLLIEWLSYMAHLQKDYPYLFSLAVRMNPMNPQAHAEVA
ncbi:hypothetical protein Gbem_3261 [Citrifermentans bemidjiense Bem]|uniref:Uncharacterized protein n=1 Tax=Citrifermentans bemidjiense (strain ATCC BAA-1014 / DSM 16622 / JCM 12645 / Bem) TaxID=404380 RepID=B5E9T4_CITBB|nr:hypothetical protein [Citrifermentans bemidjiense]ACH40258.1 hypothetical protein Gbem_3261 [Citrifermentans bemidjiense Bem]